MCQHFGALERKWNRQLTRLIFPVGVKNAVWERDYSPWILIVFPQGYWNLRISPHSHANFTKFSILLHKLLSVLGL